MIPLQIYITEYHETENTCTAKLQNGNYIKLDPFVACAVPLSDADYENGKGHDLVGRTYLLTTYSVSPDDVVPHEGGMIEL